MASRQPRRDRDLVPETLSTMNIMVVGIGSVGKQVTSMLAYMGIGHLTLVDPDEVAEENLVVQGWDKCHIGLAKVEAITDYMALDFPDSKWTGYEEEIAKMDVKGVDVVFSCVDNMKARRDIEKYASESGVKLLVDARVLGNFIRVLTCPCRIPEDRKWVELYRDSLYSDSEAQVGRCTERMTLYSANIAAGLMIAQMVHYLKSMEVRGSGYPLCPDLMMNLNTMQMAELQKGMKP